LGRRFNPAPGWPPPPPGFVPPPHWQPDPSWPPAPPGWQLWVDDSAPDTGSIPARPGEFGTGAGSAPPWADDLRAGAADARWADLSDPPSGPLTGPPTQAYVPGATGPQDPFGPGEPFGSEDPFTRQSPPDPLGAPDGPDRPGHRGRAGKADGFAIASLLLGVFGITGIGAILSINFGIMALRRVRRTGQPGRGLAIAGLVFSAIWLLIGTFFVLGAGKGPSQPSASGGPSSPSSGHSSSPTAKPSSSASPGSLSTSVFALHPGQCFQNPPASQTELGVTYVTVVPCTKAHNAQAFVQFTVRGTSWPGTDAIKRQADSGCHARIKGNVQTSKIKTSMSLRYLYPLESSWASGHRTITCLIVNSTPDLKKSLLKAHSTGH
jgi:uncharacterized protein DUF4190/putative regulator of septum formation